MTVKEEEGDTDLKVYKSPNMVRFDGIKSYYDFRQVTSDQLKTDAQKLIDDCKAVYDSVAKVEAVSFSSVIQPLLNVDADSAHRGVALQLPGMVATDKSLRDASSDAEKMLEEFEVEMSMRKDVFDNILAFSKSDEAKTLSPEMKRYVEKQVNDGMRNGLHLDEAKRDEIKAVKKRISELGVEFNKNLNEDTTFILLDQSELSGVPEDLVGSFEKDEESGSSR